MDQKQQILHHYRVDEDGLREISRKVGVDRKTVRRLIQAFEERLTKDPDLGMEEFLAERPKMRQTTQSRLFSLSQLSSRLAKCRATKVECVQSSNRVGRP